MAQLRLTVVRGTDQRTVDLTFTDEHDDEDGDGGGTRDGTGG